LFQFNGYSLSTGFMTLESDHSSKNIYELITAYTDGETTPEEFALIENHLHADEHLRRAVALEKRTKEIVRTACHKFVMPDKLFDQCIKAIEAEAQPASVTPIPISSSITPWFRWAAAAVVLIGSLIWYNLPPAPISNAVAFAVEDHVYRHFTASHISELQTTSTQEAEAYIRQNYGIQITVPELKGSRFDGIRYAEFVPGHHAPVLMYSVAGQNDPVMIFAFKVDLMDEEVRLVRDQDAVATCTHHDAVHIKDIAGKHVVSWLWEDTWYAGISNHDGNVLAAMLPINL